MLPMFSKGDKNILDEIKDDGSDSDDDEDIGTGRKSNLFAKIDDMTSKYER